MQFAPSVYEHCAFLIGRTPWDVSRSPDLLLAGQAEAYLRYHHSPVVVGVDIYNLEAEAYGAVIGQPEGCGIPAVATHPCRTLAEVAALPPFDPASAGRVPMAIETARRLKAQFPSADVRVPLAGPFSIAMNLVGMQPLLEELMFDPDGARAALDALCRGQAGFCRAVRQAGLDIAFFESAAAPPLLSPAAFAALELPPLKRLLAEAAAIVAHPVPCVIGGDTLAILGAILQTGTRYVICPAETDQAGFMAAMRDHPEVMVRVNMRPGVTAGGTPEQLQEEIERVLALAAGRQNVCIGTGALPYETPPENVLFIQRYIARKGSPS